MGEQTETLKRLDRIIELLEQLNRRFPLQSTPTNKPTLPLKADLQAVADDLRKNAIDQMRGRMPGAQWP